MKPSVTNFVSQQDKPRVSMRQLKRHYGRMKGWGYLLVLLLPAGGSAYAQTASDSTFSLFFNSSLNFNHANDPHINHWLKEYGYPTEPHVPTSLSFEAAAMPANSRLLYS